MQSPKAKSINKSRMMRGEAAGVCWVCGELCEEVAEGWALAIEIVMVGWVLEEEAGCERSGVGQGGPPGHQSRTGSCLE